jgi:hypothetical protein
MIVKPGEATAKRLDEFDAPLSAIHKLNQKDASPFVGIEHLIAAFARRSLTLDESIGQGEKKIAAVNEFLEAWPDDEASDQELDEPFQWPCLEASEDESERDQKVPDNTFSSVVGAASRGLIEPKEPFEMIVTPGEPTDKRLDESGTPLSAIHKLNQEGASSFVGTEDRRASLARLALALEESIREREKKITAINEFLEAWPVYDALDEVFGEPFPGSCLEVCEEESEEDQKVPDNTCSSVVGGASSGVIETNEPLEKVNRAFPTAEDWPIAVSQEIEPSISPFDALSGSPPMNISRSSRKTAN